MTQDDKDAIAGNAFRETLVPKADAYTYVAGEPHAPLWHGWAIMDAYLAGVKAERERVKEVVMGGRFLHDDAPPARFAREVVEAINRQ